MGVITQPLDNGVRRFYIRRGVQELPFDRRRAMLVRRVDLERALASAVLPERT